MQLSKRTFSKIALHTSIWLLFILLPALIIAPLVITCSTIQSGSAYFMLLFSSFLLLLVFYANYLYLFPKFYLAKKRWQYFIYVLLTIALAAVTTKLTADKEVTEMLLDNPKWRGTVVAVELFRLIFVLLGSCGLFMFEYWQKVENEKLKSEVAFLKAQINPHFLFNTLNGIYTLALMKSNDAPEAVSKLSAIMQYAATESAKDKILLEKEISYIGDYVELQKLRLTENTTVNFSVSGNADSFYIEPMLLISFIENAFKFGVSTELQSCIDIEMNIHQNSFHLKVRNDKVRKQPVISTSGIGLENTIQRLKTVYTNSHHLKIESSEKEYLVELTLNLA